MPTASQSMLYRAALTIGAKFGVGGSVWRLHRPSGNGISGVTVTYVGTVFAYIVRERLVQERGTAPPMLIGDEQWRIITPAGEDVQQGDTLSSDTADLAFSINTIGTEQGYPTGIVQPAARIMTAAPRLRALRQGLRQGAF